MNWTTLLKQPSAFVPLLMSAAAVALVIGYVAAVGVTHARNAGGGDEGAAAHLFQLLLAGQLPIVLYFAVKWLPREPRLALTILAFQALAGLAALVPVYMLEH